MSPFNETSPQIFAERTFLQGYLLCGVAYGAGLPLFALTLWNLWNRQQATIRKQVVFVGFVFTLFVLASLAYVSNAQAAQSAFIDNRDIPGGPDAFENSTSPESLPAIELGNVCFCLITWLCDMLLIWRFYVVYSQLRIPRYALAILPGALWLGSVATGTLFLLQASGPSSISVDGNAIVWTTAFLSLSFALNILLTIAIALRLFIFRKHIVSVLGREHGSQYTYVATIIIESAALLSIFSLLTLIPFAINSSVNNIFIQSLNHVQIIATLLITLRVAQGKGWCSDTVRQEAVSTIRFASAVHTGSTSDESSLKPSDV